MADSPVVGSASFELRASFTKLQADIAQAQSSLTAAVDKMEAAGKVELTGNAAPIITAANTGAKAVEAAAQREVAAARQASAAVASSVTEAAKKATSAHASALSSIGGLSRTQSFELIHVGRSVFDGLASGASPIRLLAQEGGRLGQVLGEGSGGLGGSLKAIGRLVLGPIGAMGALGIAFIAAAGAALKFEGSQRDLGRALQGGGRATGATVGQLEGLAESAGRAGNVSTGAARVMEEAFLRTGKIGTEAIGGLIAINRDFAAVMGIDSVHATQELATAFADPAKGADKLNESLHFLTDAQRQEIHELEESGDRLGAQKLLYDSLHGAVAGAAGQLNGLGQILHGIAAGFANAADSVGKFIYGLTHINASDGNIASLQAKLAALQADKSPINADRRFAAIDATKAQLAEAQKSRAAGNDAASNDLGSRAGNAIRSLNPDIEARRQLQEQLSLLQKEAANGFKGLAPEEAKAGKRDLDALTQALRTYIPEREKAAKIAEIQAKLALRPGSVERGQLQADLVRTQLAGQVLTPDEVNTRVASGAERGENRGSFRDAANERKRVAAENRAAAQARKEEAARDKILNEEKSFDGALRTAQDGQLEAQLAATGDVKARADLERTKVEEDREQKSREIRLGGPKDAGGTGDRTADQTRSLLAINDATAKQKLANIDADERRRVEKERADADKAGLDDQLATLRVQAELAKSTGDRRDLALKIFDTETRLERAKLAELAYSTDPKVTQAQKDQAQASLIALNARAPLQRGKIADDNASPYAAYQDSLNKTPGQINDSLQTVAVDGLKSFNDGLADAIANSKNLGEVFHGIATQILADILKITIEQQISKPLAAALPGVFGGGAALFGFAAGGQVHGAGTGTSDSILARLSHGEFVMPAAAAQKNLGLLEAMRSGLPGFADGGVVGGSTPFAVRSTGAASNAGRGGVSFDLRGAVMTQDLLAQMNEIGGRAQNNAIGVSVAHTNASLSQSQRASARAARSDLSRF